jgi:hypothetical protein
MSKRAERLAEALLADAHRKAVRDERTACRVAIRSCTAVDAVT